jgi:hypothetical protein
VLPLSLSLLLAVFVATVEPVCGVVASTVFAPEMSAAGLLELVTAWPDGSIFILPKRAAAASWLA